MQMKQFKLFTILVVLGSLASNASWAEHYKNKDDNRQQRMVEELGLNQDQVKQLQAIHENNKEAFQAKRKILKDLHAKLQTAMESNASDADLKKIFNDLQNAKKEKAESHFDKMLEIRKILTPEQRKKFKAFHGRHHNKEHSDKK